MTQSPVERNETELLQRELAPDFEILRPLGSGKVSHVFLAREPALQRLVAVKVLRSEDGADESVRARFEREGRAQAGITSPHVPAVHRVGRLASGIPYIVLEYLEGRTVADELAALGPRRPDEARRILSDVAAALAAAHAKGVIHRDVRPGNVMLRKEGGRAVLMDFGLAGVHDSGSDHEMRLTRTGEVLGDPHYISPEQLLGDVVTVESDIYSLGVLGYELLTCENPFGSKSSRELIKGHLREEPIDLPWTAIGPDRALSDLLRRCLQKLPTRRPRADELAPALAPGGGSGAGSAQKPQTDGALQHFPRLADFVEELKRRKVYQVGAAYLVGMIVLLQAADVVLEGLGAPDWALSVVTIASLVGFPVTLILSWVFDVTASGVQRTDSGAGAGRRTSVAFKVGGLTASVLLAALVGWFLLR